MGCGDRESFRACKGLKSASKVLLTPIANRCIKWGMPIERAMQYAHGSYAKLFSCVSGESLYKGVTETLIKRTAKMTCYEYFYESDYGMESGFVEATNRRELLAKMKAQFPDDIGSDGFAVDPDGNDFPLNW